MQIAIEEAIKGVNSNQGGPFGAVVCKDNQVLATGCNTVLASKDITCHAEIVAIRNACEKLGIYSERPYCF